MTTMTNRKAATPSAQLTLRGIPSELAALETGLGLTGAIFSRVERMRTRTSSNHVPDDLIELMAAHADANGGMIAGIPFDGAAAREALAQVGAAEAAVRAAKQFAQRVGDDATLQRSEVADRAYGIYGALRRIVRTPEGRAMKDTYDQMRSVVRAHHKARTARAVAPPTVTTGTAPAQTTNGAD